MAGSDKQLEPLSTIESNYEVALVAEEGGGSQSYLDFAQCLSEQAYDAARREDETACCQLLDFACNAFRDRRAASMINSILFEIFDPLPACGRSSSSSQQAFAQLVDVLIDRCSSRELLTLFLAVLDQVLRY